MKIHKEKKLLKKKIVFKNLGLNTFSNDGMIENQNACQVLNKEVHHPC
jgi:hypothetical protein